MATWRRLALACTPANQSKILCAPTGSTRSLCSLQYISIRLLTAALSLLAHSIALSIHVLVNTQVHVSGEHVAWEDPAQSDCGAPNTV